PRVSTEGGSNGGGDYDNDNDDYNDDDDDDNGPRPVLQYTLRARPSFFIDSMWHMNRDRKARSTEEHPQKLFCVIPDPGGFIIGNYLQVDSRALERILGWGPKKKDSPLNSL